MKHKYRSSISNENLVSELMCAVYTLMCDVYNTDCILKNKSVKEFIANFYNDNILDTSGLTTFLFYF